MKDNTRIAKNRTVDDWKILRKKLKNNDNLSWDEAYIFFHDRISSRFLEPIEKIQRIGKNKGEGFSIALISVVLLEFVAAFELGLIYNYFQDKNNKLPNEYKHSKDLIQDFILNSDIFKTQFASNKSLIERFYKDVRCGLVHQARTLDNTSIVYNNSGKNTKHENFYFKSETEEEYILNRDLFLKKILEHIDYYRQKILLNQDELARRLFIMKMDEIADLKHVWYFIYGSNLYEPQIIHRLNYFNDFYLKKVRCTLYDYAFVYNKESKDESAKANLIKKIGEKVEGIAILVLEGTLKPFGTRYEDGYKEETVNVKYIGRNNTLMEFKAQTFISSKVTTATPIEEYVAKIVDGAKNNNLPDDYISKYLQYD